jgi:hypothetical protein
MRASIAHTMRRSLPSALIGAWVVAVGAPTPTCANVITDWDEQAVAATAPMISLAGGAPYTASRLPARSPSLWRKSERKTGSDTSAF